MGLGGTGCAQGAARPGWPGRVRIGGRGEDGDVDGADDGRGSRAAGVTVEVAGGGAFDLAGAVAGPPGGQLGGQDRAPDDAGQVSGTGGQMPRAAVTWSRAFSRAVVKLEPGGQERLMLPGSLGLQD